MSFWSFFIEKTHIFWYNKSQKIGNGGYKSEV